MAREGGLGGQFPAWCGVIFQRNRVVQMHVRPNHSNYYFNRTMTRAIESVLIVRAVPTSAVEGAKKV
jgi:hypothetical protein